MQIAAKGNPNFVLQFAASTGIARYHHLLFQKESHCSFDQNEKAPAHL